MYSMDFPGLSDHTLEFQNEIDQNHFETRYGKYGRYYLLNAIDILTYHKRFVDGNEYVLLWDSDLFQVNHTEVVDWWEIALKSNHDIAERHLAGLEITDIIRYDEYDLASRTNLIRIVDSVCEEIKRNPECARIERRGSLLGIKGSIKLACRYIHAIFVLENAGRDQPIGSKQTQSWRLGRDIFCELGISAGVPEEWCLKTWESYCAPLDLGGNEGRPSYGSFKAWFSRILEPTYGRAWWKHIENWDSERIGNDCMDEEYM